MRIETIATSIYALLLLIGGIIGFISAQSLPSLLMGGLSALLAGICAWGIHTGKPFGKTGIIILSSLLLGFFGYRFALTAKFMPGGLMALLSAGLVLLLLCRKR